MEEFLKSIKNDVVEDIKISDQYLSYMDLSAKAFHDVTFENCLFVGCNFSRSYFLNTSFVGSHIHKCDFKNVSVTQCDFGNTSIFGSDFSESCLYNSSFENASLSKIHLFHTRFFNITFKNSCWGKSLKPRGEPGTIEFQKAFLYRFNADKKTNIDGITFEISDENYDIPEKHKIKKQREDVRCFVKQAIEEYFSLYQKK